ncbi:MAG: cadherin repeat domain-containing protein, partial [Nitrospira sp.]|nr:cadherin repeat domain-containing protein [Nitrospira sp.]
YSFTDSAGGRFAINSSTGVITVADGSLLDYEAVPSHTVTVRVTDSGGLTYDETFTIHLTNVNEAPTDVQKENGAGPPFLHSNRPVAFEGSARPAFLSQIKEDTSEGGGRVPDNGRKPVEWSSQPASLLDALRQDRNLAGRAHDGDGTKAVGSEQDRASATSPRTQDEPAVNLDAANAARPELEQAPQPPTAETENVPDDSGGLGVPMAVGLVGAVLQGHLGKKEKMTTLTGQNPTRDRQPAKEQNSEKPSVDDQVVPPGQH